jgi:ubiquinone/menaquinone biosynthesis C-methylase UbiE
MLNVETVHANLEKERGSTLEDEYLHMVVLANTLFQVEDKSVMLKEVKRVLNKDGKMVVIEWSDDAPIVPQYGHRISKDDLKKLAKELDFVLEKEFSAGNSHYGLVFSL